MGTCSSSNANEATAKSKDGSRQAQADIPRDSNGKVDILALLKRPSAGSGSASNTTLPCLLLSGAPPQNQEDFSAKPVEKTVETGEDDFSKKVGYACNKGRKPIRSMPNQDNFIMVQANDTGVYGVFDGHGPQGHMVSSYAASKMMQHLMCNSNFKELPRKALETAFEKTQRDCEVNEKRKVFDCKVSGTTATVILDLPKELRRDASCSFRSLRHFPRRLCIAHVGDSRAVLAFTSAGDQKLLAKELTLDHKLSIPEERARIEAAGGVVRKLYPDDEAERVFERNKQYPGLAMSRAIGDTAGAAIGVSSSPDVTVLHVDNDARFLLMCSDGVWEFISSQEAVELVAECLKSKPEGVQEAVDCLAAEAQRRWLEQEATAVDDITAICVILR